MSNPFTIQAGLPRQGSGETAAPSRASASTQVSSPNPTKPTQVFVNPSFRFDPSIGLVVIEFHDNAGKLTNSIPSQRQLEAYRTHQETPSGEPPPLSSPPVDGKTPTG